MLLVSATYEQTSDRVVRVRGSVFQPSAQGAYTIKLEGARIGGYRSVFMGGVRDPILCFQIDDLVSLVKGYIKSRITYEYDLQIHVYGKNAVMGRLEPDTMTVPKEICICGEARARSQTEADHVLGTARMACIYRPYTNQRATAGKFAMPFSSVTIPVGQICEFCVYHLMRVDDPVALFPIMSQIMGSDHASTTHLSRDGQVTGMETLEKSLIHDDGSKATMKRKKMDIPRAILDKSSIP